jgi:hypothetical protein
LFIIYIDFLAASVAMTITISVGFPPHIYSINPPHVAERISILCKIRGYLAQSSTMMYRWFMAMACIDRYIASSNNVYLRQFSNPRMAYSIVIKIFIIWIILPLHNLIFLDIKSDLCINSTTAFAIYHSLFTFTFGGILPLLIMIISIILIRCNLASKRARRKRSIHHYRTENETVRFLNIRDQQVLIMLFIQLGFYIISTIPWLVFLIYASYTRRIMNKSIDQIVTERFFRYLTEIIILMYPTLSFYIYTLTSHTFRGELVNIIRTLFSIRDRLQYDPRPELIQTQGGWNGKGDQFNEIDKFRSIEMDKCLDDSKTNGSSDEQQEINPTK